MTDMRTRFIETTIDLVDSDPLAAVVLADISADQFADVAHRHPDRVLNVGIREQLMLGVAGGLALAGLRPVAHSYAPFLVERAYEQVKLDFGHQDAHGTLVSIGASYDWTEGGRTHQSPGDVALIDTLPNWSVHVPGHPDEVPGYVRAGLRGTTPAPPLAPPARAASPGSLGRSAGGQGHSTYLRLSTTSNASPRPAATDGTLDVVRSGGNGPLVLAVGPMLDPVLAATRDLDVTVAYATTVRPLDTAGLRELAVNGEIVLVEPYLAGTSARLVDEALTDRPHRTLSLGVRRTELRQYGTVPDHDAAHGLDPSGLRRSIETFLD